MLGMQDVFPSVLPIIFGHSLIVTLLYTHLHDVVVDTHVHYISDLVVQCCGVSVCVCVCVCVSIKVGRGILNFIITVIVETVAIFVYTLMHGACG